MTVVRQQKNILDDIAGYVELGADFTVSIYTTNAERSYIDAPVLALYDNGMSIQGDDDQPILVYLSNIVSIEINERT